MSLDLDKLAEDESVLVPKYRRHCSNYSHMVKRSMIPFPERASS